APLIAGDDGGSEELGLSEVPVGGHLVYSRRTRVVGVEKQQPSRLPRVVAVDSDDRPAAAASRRAQGDLGILRRRGRNAPHSGGVVIGSQTAGLPPHLSESGIAWHRIPAISFVQGILSPGKG